MLGIRGWGGGLGLVFLFLGIRQPPPPGLIWEETGFGEGAGQAKGMGDPAGQGPGEQEAQPGPWGWLEVGDPDPVLRQGGERLTEIAGGRNWAGPCVLDL